MTIQVRDGLSYIVYRTVVNMFSVCSKVSELRILQYNIRKMWFSTYIYTHPLHRLKVGQDNWKREV